MTLPDTSEGPGRLGGRSLVEATVVLGLPMALFLGAFRWESEHLGVPAMEFTDPSVLGTLTIEAVLAAALLPWLRRRGWRPGRVAGSPGPVDVLRGGALWIGGMAAAYAAFLLVYAAAPEWAEALAAQRYHGTLSAAVVMLASVWNPLFEEFLWLGYAVPALEPRFGLRVACVVSLACRLAVHAYQGPAALVGVLPLTLVFTLYYARTRRLWPVVVAHAVGDAIALTALMVPAN